MISAVNDYKFVTPSGILIDGDLYPKRKARGDGSEHVLRGEDASFLREAACRVSYLDGWDAGSEIVYAYFPGSTAPHCAGLCEKYIIKDPLQVAAETLRDVRDVYARSQLSATPVFD